MADGQGITPAGAMPVGPAGRSYPGSPAGTRRPALPAAGGEPRGRFAEILRDKLAGVPAGRLQFSRHALERLQAAGRTVTPAQLKAVEEAVERAAAKGARESLVLMADLALVVSVRNRTVITAVDQARIRQQVFTNIDSAVIVKD